MLVRRGRPAHTRPMAMFRAESHIEVRGRRVRASVSVALTVSLEDESAADVRPAERRRPVAWVPTGLRDPGVRWDALPDRIRPEDWSTGQADPEVPGSLLAAEAERRPEGFRPGG